MSYTGVDVLRCLSLCFCLKGKYSPVLSYIIFEAHVPLPPLVYVLSSLRYRRNQTLVKTVSRLCTRANVISFWFKRQ